MSLIASHLEHGKFDPQEIELIKLANMYMNTLRLAGMVPEWGIFIQTEQYREFLVNHQNTGKRVIRFQAIWKLLYEVMRDDKDIMSIAYAIAYRVKRQCERAYSKAPNIHPEIYKLPPDHIKKIEECVERLFRDIDK